MFGLEPPTVWEEVSLRLQSLSLVFGIGRCKLLKN